MSQAYAAAAYLDAEHVEEHVVGDVVGGVELVGVIEGRRSGDERGNAWTSG